MKIGIITQPLATNYGGILQNYALQFTLRKLGHNPVTIDWNASNSFKEELWRKKQRILYQLGVKGVEKPIYIPNKRDFNIISKQIDYFINKYIERTDKITKEEGFKKSVEGLGCEALVVGSDQVWRPGYNGFPKAMFLDFTQEINLIRVAYAASFGTSKWEYTPQMTTICAKLAKNFDLVTVREDSGVSLCRDRLGIEAAHVLDPTMLLTKEDYECLVICEKEPQSKGNLFHYILDPSEEKKSLIEDVASRQGLKPFTIMPKCQAENRTRWDVKHRINDCVFPSVTCWLRGFMDAKMVIVDSFHGAVFSIIFNKPFWIIENSNRGNARFESLLRMYGLEDRMIDAANATPNDWDKPIDWARVNGKKEEKRQESINLLKKALG